MQSAEMVAQVWPGHCCWPPHVHTANCQTACPLPSPSPSCPGCVVSVGFNPRLFHLPKKGGAEGEVEDKLTAVFALGSQDKRISGEGAGWCDQLAGWWGVGGCCFRASWSVQACCLLSRVPVIGCLPARPCLQSGLPRTPPRSWWASASSAARSPTWPGRPMASRCWPPPATVRAGSVLGGQPQREWL